MADRTSTITLRVADQFSAPLRALESGLQGAEHAMGRMRTAGERLEPLGRTLSVGITAPVVAMGGLALKSAADFDKAMRNVNSIAKVSEAEFGKMRVDVLALSKELPQSAETLAKGLYDIESSGFAGQEAIDVLRASAEAASAGLTTTATSARVITGVLNAYGAESYTAQQAADILFKTVDKGVVTFEELAQSLGDVMPTAAALHVPLETVGAAFAVLTRRGINAAEAGTSINRIMLSLLSPSKEAQKVAASLGLEWNAQALAAKGLVGVLQDMLEKTGGSKEAIADLTGDVRSLRGVLSLTQDGGELFNQMQTEMTQNAGAMKGALEEQSKAFSFQADILKNQLTAALIELATKALPGLTSATQGAQEALSKLGPEGTANVAMIAAVLAAGGPLLLGISAVEKAIAKLRTAFITLRVAALVEIAAIVAVVVGLIAIVHMAITKFDEFKDAVARGVTEPGGFGGGMGMLWRAAGQVGASGGFRQSLGDVTGAISRMATDIIGAAMQTIAPPADQGTESAQALSEALDDVNRSGLDVSGAMDQAAADIGDAANTSDRLTESTKVATEWFDADAAAVAGLGDTAVEQSAIVEQSSKDLLSDADAFMTGVTEAALSALEEAKRRYDELIASMITASSAFADAFSEVEDLGGFQVGGRVRSIPVPSFAAGGTTAMVGELGPELVHLPGGSRVVNAADTAMLTRAGRASGGPEVHLHVGAMMGSDRDAQEFARKLHGYLVRERDWS